MNSSKIRRQSRKNKQHGFSLLEVMVSVLVLGIGVLGLAYLQTWGTRFGQESHYRSQATTIAYDFIDRIRANVLRAPQGYQGLTITDLTTAPSSVGTTSCIDPVDTLTRETLDRDCFFNNLTAALPSGNALVTSATTPQGTLSLTIQVGWNDRNLVVANPNSTATQPCNPPRMSSADFSWGHATDPGAGVCMQVSTWVVELGTI